MGPACKAAPSLDSFSVLSGSASFSSDVGFFAAAVALPPPDCVKSNLIHIQSLLS